MDKNERDICGRLLEAVSELDEPQRGFDKVLHAICDLAGTPHGGMWGVPKNFLAAPRLADVSYIDPSDGCREIHTYLPTYPAFEYLVVNWNSLSIFKPIDVLGWNAWTRSGFYQDYLRRYDRKDNIAGVMRDSAGAPRWIYSLCHEGRNAFKPRVLEIMKKLNPSVARGLENLERWRGRLERFESMELILQNTEDPIVALRLRGHGQLPVLLNASAAALRVLGLNAAPSSANLHFEEFLRLSPHAATGHGSRAVEWQAGDGRRFSLTALRAGATAPPGTLLVRLVAAPTAPSLQQDREAAQRSGLSHRESDIFALLATGSGNREIGRELHISPNTARTHIVNIFAKLGVSNRVEAVNRVRSERPRKVTAIIEAKNEGQAPPQKKSGA